MELNTPFEIINAKFLGIGIGLCYLKNAGELILEVEAVFWRWDKTWSV